MKRNSMPHVVALVIVTLLCLPSVSSGEGEGEATQVVELQPGWNSIFLQVQPEPQEPAEVFADVPVECVWAWLDWRATVGFIRDPMKGLGGQPGWHAYYASPEESFLSNLHAIQAGRAYLIKLGGSDPVTWTVEGRPSVKEITWVADSFNLVGFSLNPDNASPPTCTEFFKPASAHDGQPYYYLRSDGHWELIDDPSSYALRAGEAHWIYCEGGSTYQGPLDVELPMLDGLEYGSGLTRLSYTLRNLGEKDRTITTSLSGDVVLAYRQYDPDSGLFVWLPLDNMPELVVGPGLSENVTLAVRREQMPVGLSEGVLQITDDKGFRMQVPVSAERTQ